MRYIGTLFEIAYVALMTNLLLIVACLPLTAVLMTTDTSRSWPLIALLAPLCAPAVTAAFTVLGRYSSDRDTAVINNFGRSWRATARRSAVVAGLASAALVVLGVDAAAAWGRPVGAVVLPVLVVAMVMTVATTLLVLVVLSEHPRVRLRDAGRACVYLAVRHWYLTVFSLLLLAAFQSLLATRPAIALGLLPAPLLYLIGANSRVSLLPVFGTQSLREGTS